jgi:hypothetical protein
MDEVMIWQARIGLSENSNDALRILAHTMALSYRLLPQWHEVQSAVTKVILSFAIDPKRNTANL